MAGGMRTKFREQVLPSCAQSRHDYFHHLQYPLAIYLSTGLLESKLATLGVTPLLDGGSKRYSKDA